MSATPPKTLTQRFRENPFAFIASAIVFLVMGAILVLFFQKESYLLEALAKEPTARGSITFLIAFTTVAIALILTLYIAMSESEQAVDRFTKGKEVLTLLIGVLGTIVGFYYGSAKGEQQTKAANQAQQIRFAAVNLSNETLTKAQPITLTAKLTEGEIDTYTIVFTPSNIINEVKDVKSADGTINQKLEVMETVTAPAEVSYEIRFTTKAKVAGTYKEETKKIKVVP
jgi:hypothetical protein